MSVHAEDTIVREIEIHAPAERVFDALAQPEQRVRWWGGGRAGSPEMESDLRPGGKWSMRFGSWDGTPAGVRGEYRVVDRPNALEFTWIPDWYEDAGESLVRFDFFEKGGITTVRVTHSGLRTPADRAGHQGWPHILKTLQEYAQGA